MHFFRLAASKLSHYLRIQPSEYVGFLYVSWWRERERKRGEEQLPFAR
jgi:hypothetical protein